MADSHSGRNSVRVDNHIRDNSLDGKGQIFLPVSNTASTFLSMSTGKLVSNLRDLYCSHFNFDVAPAIIVCGQNNLINIAFLTVLKRCWLIFVRLGRILLRNFFCGQGEPSDWLYFTDDDVISGNLLSWADDSIFIQFVVGAGLPAWSLSKVWDTEALLIILGVIIRSEKHRPKEASVDSALIYHNRIFLVVTWVAADGDDRVDSSGKLFEFEVLHRSGLHQGFLRVV